jgi:hypothetical protein
MLLSLVPPGPGRVLSVSLLSVVLLVRVVCAVSVQRAYALIRSCCVHACVPQVPRFWLVGHDESRKPLLPQQVRGS